MTNQKARIETTGARACAEETLRPRPDQENGGGNEKCEGRLSERCEMIAAPEPEQQYAPENRLRRINPKLGVPQHECVARNWHPFADRQQDEKRGHRQDVREQRLALRLHCLPKRPRYSCGMPDEDKPETADALMRAIELE